MLAGRAATLIRMKLPSRDSVASLGGLASPLFHNPRLFITTLLSTTTVAALQTNKALENKNNNNSNNKTSIHLHPACCSQPAFSTFVSYWTRKSCLASDLMELQYTNRSARKTGFSRKFSSGSSISGGGGEGEECLKWYDVDTPELLDLLKGSENLQLFDVREPEELAESGIIPGAVNIPLGQVEEALALEPEAFKEKYKADKPSKMDTNILFHCRAGVRSMTALEAAHRLGFSKARHYVKGFLGWEDYLDSQKGTTKSG